MKMSERGREREWGERKKREGRNREKERGEREKEREGKEKERERERERERGKRKRERERIKRVKDRLCKRCYNGRGRAGYTIHSASQQSLIPALLYPLYRYCLLVGVCYVIISFTSYTEILCCALNTVMRVFIDHQ